MWNSNFTMLRLMGAADPFMPMANGGKGGGSAPDPDPNIGVAALRNAEISKEALDWYKDIYAKDAPYRDELRSISSEMAKSQVDASRQNQAYADDYYGYMKNTFRPVERGIVQEADRYNVEAERERQALAAASDVEGAAANRRTQLARSLSAMGVNPNSGRFAALNQDASIMDAATRAGAMTKARTNAEQLGWAKRMDAASLGRNLPANQATSQGLALTAGRSAIDSANAPAANTAAYGAMMGTGFNTAIQGNQSTANILNAQYANQINAWSAQQQAAASESAGLWGGLGTAAGIAVAMSSKKVKTDKQPAPPALKGLREVPVESWKYKDGEGDGGQHVGPYAEDVHKQFGDAAAPGGKMIDLISMIGINTKAIQELDQKVSRIERRK